VFLIVYIGFAFTLNLVAIAAMFLFYGVYQGSFRSVSRALASDLAPEHLRASGIGWFSATVGLCQLIAGIVAGLLWDVLSHRSAFLYGIASAVAGIIATMVLVPRERERRTHEATPGNRSSVVPPILTVSAGHIVGAVCPPLFFLARMYL
jgi:MFS family permease